MIPQLLTRMAVGAIFGASAWTMLTNQTAKEELLRNPPVAPAPAGNGRPPAPEQQRRGRVYH